MKPKPPYLEFYENKKHIFKDSVILTEHDEKYLNIEEKLTQATNFPALKQLCLGQEDAMFVVLQTFLMLPIAKEKQSLSTKMKRAVKNEPTRIKAYVNRLAEKASEAISKVNYLDPSINKELFKKKFAEWASYKTDMKLKGHGDIDDAIEFVCMIDPQLDKVALRKRLNTWDPQRYYEDIKKAVLKRLKISGQEVETDIGFNNLLRIVFDYCKGKTGETQYFVCSKMAAVLNTLEITTMQGRKFSGKAIEEILRRTPA